MKFILLLALLSGSALSQITTPNPIVFPGVPSGSCSAPNTAVNTSNGDFYTCTSGSWVKVGGAGGIPGGSNTQIQINNSGAFGGISNAAAGSVLASQGVSTLPIFQPKLAKDVRDFGVVCGTGIDNTTALQAAINGTPNFSELDIPLGCRIEVSSTINIHNFWGLWIKAKGGSRPGVLGQQMPSIVWKGADHGGPVIDVNCSAWMLWDGFAIFLQDGHLANNADVGVDIREHSCSQITTNNVYKNMAFESEDANTSRVMIRIGFGSFVGNIEHQEFYNCTMIGDMGLGTFSTTQGIGLQQLGQEPADTIWDGGAASGLTTGFDIHVFNITISHTLGGSYTDIQCAATCNSHDNRWENSVLPWVLLTGASVITEKDDISTLGTPNPIFTLPDGGANIVLVMRDFQSGGANLSTTFNTLATPMTGGSITIEGSNRLPDIPVWSNYCSTGCTVNALGTVDVIGSSIPSPATLHGIGMNLQSNQTGGGGLQAISPPLNLIASWHAPINDTFSLLNTTGGLAWVHSGAAPLGPAGFGFPFSSLATMALGNLAINAVTPIGTPGGTTYTYKIVDHSQNGTTAASAAVSTATGNASLSSTNYNQISWFPNPGSTQTDIYRTVGGGSTGLIGSVFPGGNNGTNFTFFFKDTGLTGDATTAPSTNTTGGLFVGCTTVACGTFSASINTAGQFASNLATGTAPLSIASTTPVANLTTVPTTYNHSGTQQLATHLVQDSCTLGTDCAVTLAGAAVYTNSTSYTCVCEDDTAIAACKIAQTSGSAFTITGTGTDSIRYHCVGN